MTRREQITQLEAIERKAWRVYMRDVVPAGWNPQKQYVTDASRAWEQAADACRMFRTAHGLIGVPTRMIKG